MTEDCNVRHVVSVGLCSNEDVSPAFACPPPACALQVAEMRGKLEAAQARLSDAQDKAAAATASEAAAAARVANLERELASRDAAAAREVAAASAPEQVGGSRTMGGGRRVGAAPTSHLFLAAWTSLSCSSP